MWLFILVVIVVLLIRHHKKKTEPVHAQPSRQQGFSIEKHKEELRRRKDMDRLTPEGELPWGWVTAYEDFIKEAQTEVMYFYKEYNDNRYGEPLKWYAALKSLLLYFEDAKKIYAKKGECFLYWFVATWAQDEEVKRLTDELHYLEEHIDELEEEYKRRQYIEHILIPDLKKKALEIVKNHPGIIQTDVYTHFEPEVKNYVQDACRTLYKEGKIKREKHGRTFKLTV